MCIDFPSSWYVLSFSEYCENVSSDKSINVTWLYAVEFKPSLSEEEMDAAVRIMELQLVSEVMSCNDPTRKQRNRRLLMDGVAGLDYMPRDTKREDAVCFSNSSIGGLCSTYDGIMELHLEETVEDRAGMNDLLFQVQSTMQRTDFPAVPEIVKVWYLGPEVAGVSGITGDSPKSIDATPTSQSSVPSGVVAAFSALGFFVFVALMIGMFRVRGNRTEEGSLTIDPGSALSGSTNNTSSKQPSISPFSAMLPTAYNLHDPETMSAILEGDSDSESRAQSSVIVSEGGFTSDGDSIVDESMYTTTNLDPVLGAQKMEDELDEDRAFLFEDDPEVSSIDKGQTSKIGFSS